MALGQPGGHGAHFGVSTPFAQCLLISARPLSQMIVWNVTKIYALHPRSGCAIRGIQFLRLSAENDTTRESKGNDGRGMGAGE